MKSTQIFLLIALVSLTNDWEWVLSMIFLPIFCSYGAFPNFCPKSKTLNMMKYLSIILFSLFFPTQMQAQHTFFKVKGGVFPKYDLSYEIMVEQMFKKKHALQISYRTAIPASNFYPDGGTGNIKLGMLEYKYLFHKPKGDELRAYYISLITQFGKSQYSGGCFASFSKNTIVGLGPCVGKYFPFFSYFSFNPHIGFCVQSIHIKSWEGNITSGNQVAYERNSIAFYPRIGFALGIKISAFWEK